MCRALQVNRTSFHDWERRAPSDRALGDAWLIDKIKTIHADSDGTYGARRVHAELRLEHGVRVGRKRVERLMRVAGISGLLPRKRRRTTVRLPGVRVAPDLVERDFNPTGPNQTWSADITYISTWEGFLYLAHVQDLYSRRIVGWSMADHLRSELVVDALEMALHRRRPDPGLVHHSDKGCQGEFNWSSQRSIGEGCDGQAEGVGVGSGGSAGDAFAGASAGGAPRASAAVLGGDCSWAEQRGGRDRGGCVAGGRRPVVSGGWWGATCQSGAVVGAVSVVRGARGDRAFACAGSGRARDRPAARALAVDDRA
jgi:putative transposase